jgi:hypothetical protein
MNALAVVGEWMMLNNVSIGDIILNALLALFGLAIVVSLWKLHSKNGRYQNFNLVNLITNKDGFADGAKCFEVGVFLLMGWGFVVMITSKSIQEWYVVLFVTTFVLRGAYGAHLRSRNAPDQPGTTTTTQIMSKTTEV